MSAPPLPLAFKIGSWLFKKTMPNLEGRWFYLMETINSARFPYRGMIVQYDVRVIQEGNWLRAVAEKIEEASKSGGTFSYLHKNRVQATLEGVVKFDLRRLRWSVEWLVRENGHRNGRQSHGTQTLTQFGCHVMSGSFTASAADSDGVVHWSRKRQVLPKFS